MTDLLLLDTLRDAVQPLTERRGTMTRWWKTSATQDWCCWGRPRMGRTSSIAKELKSPNT